MEIIVYTASSVFARLGMLHLTVVLYFLLIVNSRVNIIAEANYTITLQQSCLYYLIDN